MNTSFQGVVVQNQPASFSAVSSLTIPSRPSYQFTYSGYGMIYQTVASSGGGSGGTGSDNKPDKDKLTKKECRDKMDEIIARARELYNRWLDFWKDKQNWQTVDPQGREYQGHLQQYANKQANMKSLLDEFNKGKCGGRGGYDNEDELLQYARLMSGYAPPPLYDPFNPRRGTQAPVPTVPPVVPFVPIDPVVPTMPVGDIPYRRFRSQSSRFLFLFHEGML